MSFHNLFFVTNYKTKLLFAEEIKNTIQKSKMEFDRGLLFAAGMHGVRWRT